jgi:ABC-2 type transport system permease protein
MFAVSGLTMAVSACHRSRWKAVGYAVLIVVGMFVANVLGQLWEPMAVLRPASVFFYYQPQDVWLNGNVWVELGDAWNGYRPLLAVPGFAVLTGVGLAGYLVAWQVFDRRDLPAPL